jgi:hypothetical protein
MSHSERIHSCRSAGCASAVGSEMVRNAVSRVVLLLVVMVRVRVIRMACLACEKAIPPGVRTVMALTVRVSDRPWAWSRVWCPIGICAGGRHVSRPAYVPARTTDPSGRQRILTGLQLRHTATHGILR